MAHTPTGAQHSYPPVQAAGSYLHDSTPTPKLSSTAEDTTPEDTTPEDTTEEEIHVQYLENLSEVGNCKDSSQGGHC